MGYIKIIETVLIKVLTIVCAFSFSLPLLAQQNSSKDTDFQSQFDKFAKQQQSDFKQFTSQVDAEFVKMLEENWQEFDVMAPRIRDKTPKPTIAPSIKKDTKEVVVKKVIFATTTKQPSSRTVNFFGNELEFPNVKFATLESVNKDALIKFWKDNSLINHKNLFDRFNSLKSSLQLSDWAFWKLIQQYSRKFSDENNTAIALQWYLLNKLGYQSKTAISKGALILLMPAEQNVYSVNYYPMKGVLFYQFAGNKAETITSYKGSYNKTGLKLDLSFTKSLETKPNIRFRTLDYKFSGRKHHLKLAYDYQRVRYFSDYPQLDLKYYFEATIGEKTLIGLQSISQQLEGSQENKINQLLAIIHQSFPYAIDKAQFGKENYLMIEETLHYQASDCEDRSFLFAWLATNLLNEKVVGLSYPGHVATGVERNGEIISADPTYIGSKIGEIMDNYINVKPKLIRYKY